MCSDILSLNSREPVSQASSAPACPAWPKHNTVRRLIGSDSGGYSGGREGGRKSEDSEQEGEEEATERNKECLYILIF